MPPNDSVPSDHANMSRIPLLPSKKQKQQKKHSPASTPSQSDTLIDLPSPKQSYPINIYSPQILFSRSPSPNPPSAPLSISKPILPVRHRLKKPLRNIVKKGSLSYSSVIQDRSLASALLPPANVNSLREIELQEVIKNPQLRHDIVFDPQLQFRPNLDGDRGRRKKLSTELYWTAVLSECQALASSSDPSHAARIVDSPSSKLKSLFISLRDILDSLLPARDRFHVHSVLDPDLILQRLRHSVLDFSALANWLALVFKAHCAPMRDAWVDQMVTRVHSGVETQSPLRIVEGLRMIFAILEAMKLDVANHQIRTLRPVMVENAIDFELDYYSQMIEKNKFSLDDSLEWYSRSLEKFLATSTYSTATSENTLRSAFCYGLTRLLSCASDEIVTEFPSTFAFDFARLAAFRAELRQIVCLDICVMHYSQLLRSHLSKAPINNLQRKSIYNSATADLDSLKQDILAIVADDYGNSKWTKNTSALALELAKRVFHSTDTSSSLPPDDLVDTIYNLLSKNMQPRARLYALVETKLLTPLCSALATTLSAIAALDTPPSLTTLPSLPPLPPSLAPFAARLLVLAQFHWAVFGRFYVRCGAGAGTDDARSVHSQSTVSESSRSVPRAKEAKGRGVVTQAADEIAL